MSAALDRSRRAVERTRPFAREYPFAPRFLELGEVALHYVDEGPRDAEPLLFVHGNPTWSFLWRKLIARFSSERRCVAPDHIGCGWSDKPQEYDYTLEQHVANLVALVERLELRNITLVMHDWGGAIGMGLATRFPQRIARLVVMNTAAFTGGKAPLRIRVCRTPILGELAVRGFNAFAGAARVMATEQPGGLRGEIAKGMLAPYSNWRERIATLRFVEDIPLARSHRSYATLEQIEQGLSKLSDKPMCVIWGLRDWCFTPWYLEQWRARFPKAQVHVAENAGHWVSEDEPENVARWMQEFLAAHPLKP